MTDTGSERKKLNGADRVPRGPGLPGDRQHTGDEPHLLREIIRTYQALMAGFSRKVGMPASRFVLIRLLAVSDREMGIMDLARKLGINAAAVTRQVKEMEAEGFILRRTDPADKRRSYVSLSPRGMEAFEEIHDRGHELERLLCEVISRDEMRDAAAVLGKLRDFMASLL